ncbi:hypothetical protein AJ80_06195 [Polytolypa hystricis UAMH7299]|uniref:Uncharacterized protein n=1 Tax=Polytolypa hystricis (strain UAMH7299) TaxID=1447883 RepID=A0A2B7XZA9_POLH7|nr:hypothetical protein AJ80_06195 [Polytolypa hystricis UAMH7299]
MATTWSLDFCLVCDRQTLGGAYCSQTCRLAELDACSTGSEPSSPTTGPQNAWSSTRNENGLGLLGPAIDFTAYKSPTSTHYHYPQTSFSTYVQSSRRGLTPSSSQTSLSSLQSISTTTSALSDEVQSELDDYAGCFDRVRDWKRRLATS